MLDNCLIALHFMLRLFAALLFVRAATHKLSSWSKFSGTVGNYHLLPARLVSAAAMIVPAAEALVAVALLADATRRLGELGATLLLTIYAAAIAVNLHRGRNFIDCGCGDPRTRQPLNRVLVGRNLAMASLLFLGALSSGTRPRLPEVLVAGAAAFCAFMLYLGHEQLLSLSLRPRPLLSQALRRLAWTR